MTSTFHSDTFLVPRLKFHNRESYTEGILIQILRLADKYVGEDDCDEDVEGREGERE